MTLDKCEGSVAGVVVFAVVVAVGLGASVYVTTITNDHGGNGGVTTPATPASDRYNSTCGWCGPLINVTIGLENTLVTPHFNHSVELTSVNQRELIYYLQKAFEQNQAFGFTATFGKYGFFINTINGLTSTFSVNETWWKITRGNGSMLNLGVSSYIPQDNEVIIFSFVQGFEEHK